MTAITFRDSLTGQPGTVRPSRGRPLAMYVCGPTVNDRAHVGHGRTYLYFDLIRRFYADAGVRVRHVMNITDFEDKITERAIRLGISWRALARREESRFKRDLADLNLLPPHLTPRASAFVPEMIRLIQSLERRGHVVRDGDSWYYRTSRPHDPRNFPIGAELTRHAVPEAGQPVEALDLVNRDFLVWRQQLPPQASWSSPWGRGAPGWHLECFTMARRHLGIPVDLHGGGADLIFPHHYAENEIALTLNDSLFSRHFLHTAFVTENGVKMSKSKGNLVPLRDALGRFGAAPLRWYLTSLPYATRLEWSDRGLEWANERLNRLRSTLRDALAPGAGGSTAVGELRALVRDVRAAVANGLQFERTHAILQDWADTLDGRANARVEAGGRPGARRELARLSELLGIRFP